MRTETRTIRIGENMGPIDYGYDFRSHFNNLCSSDAVKQEYCDRAVAVLRAAEAKFRAGEKVWVRRDEYWHQVLDVGMYDGWPYWRPTPAIFVRGPLSGEWCFFYDLREVETRQ